MEKSAKSFSKKAEFLLYKFLAYASFLSLSLGLFSILAASIWKSLPLKVFNIWTSWADFRCSWQCLRSEVATFLIAGGFKTILFIFLIGLFTRALFLLTMRLRKTKALKKTLESLASPRKDWEIDYFIFPFAYPLALTIGWFYPKIFLSTSLVNSFSSEELKTVLLHEVFHQKKRDTLKNLILTFFADVLFILPVTKNLRDFFGLIQELQADCQALERGKNLTSLLVALNKIHKAKAPQDFNLTSFSVFFFNDQERQQYFSYGRLKTNLSWRKFAISVMMVAFFTILIFSPYGQSSKNIILNHKSICVSHSIVKEERAR